MMVPCSSCGEEIRHDEAHPFEETKKGRTKEFKLCVRCCPNCFGSVGSDSWDVDGGKSST